MQAEAVELYASSKDGERKKKIEVVGFEQSYDWRKDIQKGGEFACQEMKISEIGTDLRTIIPFTQYMYLENNLLYKWDQIFDLSSQLKYLHTLNISFNRLN